MTNIFYFFNGNVALSEFIYGISLRLMLEWTISKQAIYERLKLDDRARDSTKIELLQQCQKRHD